MSAVRLELREPASAQRFPERPGNEGKNNDQRKAEKYQCGTVLFGVISEFLDLAAADVHQRDGDDGHNGVLYREKAEARRFHGRAHVETNIWTNEQEKDAQQHLDVQEDHEEKPGFCVRSAVGGFAANADECTNNGPDAEQQDQPSYK